MGRDEGAGEGREEEEVAGGSRRRGEVRKRGNGGQVKAMEMHLLTMGTGRWEELRAQVRGGEGMKKQV